MPREGRDVETEAIAGPEAFIGLSGFIFDCDGVLFDSKQSNIMYYNAILDRMGLSPMTREQIDFVHSHTVHQSLAHIIPKSQYNQIPDAVAEVDYRRDVLPWVTPEPGMFDFMAWLGERGFKRAIHTNRTTTMAWLVELHGLDAYFSPIIDASMVPAKPDPAGLFRVLEAWELTQEQTVFVGDSELDMLAAEAAGMRFWSFRNPELRAALNAPDFPALEKAMRAGME